MHLVISSSIYSDVILFTSLMKLFKKLISFSDILLIHYFSHWDWANPNRRGVMTILACCLALGTDEFFESRVIRGRGWLKSGNKFFGGISASIYFSGFFDGVVSS